MMLKNFVDFPIIIQYTYILYIALEKNHKTLTKFAHNYTFVKLISPALECIGAVQRGREKEHKSR